jgi:hypothetical protein
MCKRDDSGSLFFNYKNFFSTVLRALVDADWARMVHLMTLTSLRIVTFVKKLEGNHVNIPGPRPLPNKDNGTPMPFVIVEDEAFTLSQHVLRPYPSTNLAVARRMCNYRLTRARRIVE